MPAGREDVLLIRHAETEWSRAGRHTGRTDLPLTEEGRAQASALAPVLTRFEIARAFASPLARARQTCELAGFAARMELDADLVEWDYGELEGLTRDEIERGSPGWQIFRDGCPGGETPADVAARVDRVIAKLRALPDRVAVFSHGHLSRVFAARWLGLPIGGASHFLLNTSTLSVLGYYRDTPALKRWNAPILERSTPS